MIIEVFLLLQVGAIVGLVTTFHAKSVMPSLLTIFTSGILIAGAWVLETGQSYVWDPSIRAYTVEAVVHQTNYIPYINIAIFGLALLFFINDIMTIAKGGRIESWTDNLSKGEETK